MPNNTAAILPTIRRLVWLYIILIVLEGALRKWFLPSLSNALLLSRDLVIFIAYILVIPRKCFPVNRFIISLFLIVGIMVLTTTLLGHANPFVMIYGVRTNALHFPFAFIIGAALARKDVIEVGRWWLYATIPMTAIIALQFYSPQNAWINASVGGGDGGAGFSGALGYYRPPGTFSFINGVALFYTYSTAFLVAGLTQHKRYSKWLLVASAAAITLAAPISISRSLVLMSGFTLVVGLLASGMQKHAFTRYCKFAIFFVIAFIIAEQVPVFHEAKDAFLTRWERSTGERQGGVKEAIGGRVLGLFTRPFEDIDDIPFFGYGIGAGTQVGNQELSGSREFNLGESEWSRIIGESGILIGLMFIIWRLCLVFKLGYYSLMASLKGNGLPMILLAAAIFNLLTGQIGQTTIQGFTIMGIGLIISSIRTSPSSPTKEGATDAS